MRSLSFHELVFMLTNQISDIIKFPIKLYSMTMVLIFWYYKYWYVFITKSDQTQDLIWADPTLEQYSFSKWKDREFVTASHSQIISHVSITNRLMSHGLTHQEKCVQFDLCWVMFFTWVRSLYLDLCWVMFFTFY